VEDLIGRSANCNLAVCKRNRDGDRVRALHGEGKTVSDIVRQTGFDRRTIAKWIGLDALRDRNASAPKTSSPRYFEDTCRAVGRKVACAAGNCFVAADSSKPASSNRSMWGRSRRLVPFAAFVEAMRTNVLTGDTPFRRAYIRSVIDQVEVDDAEIRIIGRRTTLERLVMGGGAAPAGVPSFVRKWRARRDSNS
jgi:hypothetical protein